MAHGLQQRRGDVVATQDHRIELRTVLAQPAHRLGHPRVIQHFDADLLKRFRIATVERAVLGEEIDLITECDQQLHQIDHAHRTGILVRMRRGRIDNQHAPTDTVFARERNRRARLRLLRQHRGPAFEELLLVDDLVLLHPGRRVGAGRHPFEMEHGRGRLIEHAQAGFAHLEGEVGVRR